MSEHPFDNIIIGLELEFGYKKLLKVSFEKLKNEYDNFFLNKVYKEYFDKEILPDLKKFFPNYDFEFVKDSKNIEFKNNMIFVTIDGSLEHVSRSKTNPSVKIFLYGYELITSPLKAENGYELEKKLKNLLISFKNFINSSDRYEIPSTAGLHVNISLMDKPLSIFLKAVLSTMFDQAYKIENDDIRKEFAENSLKYVLDKYNIINFYDILVQTDKRKFQNFMNEIDKLLSKEFFYASIRPRKNYIEFRVLGGENYHENIDNILEQIKKFASYVKISENKLKKKAEELVKRIYKHSFRNELNRTIKNVLKIFPSKSEIVKTYQDIKDIHELTKTVKEDLKNIIKYKDWKKLKELYSFLSLLADERIISPHSGLFIFVKNYLKKLKLNSIYV